MKSIINEEIKLDETIHSAMVIEKNSVFTGERIAIQGLQPETLSSIGAAGTQGK